MANLSNINGKFVVEQTTGYVGVGTTDPNYPIEVLNASAEIALNASGGSIYRIQSDSASNFIIRKEGVGDRLVINSAGNATFAGNVILNNSDIAFKHSDGFQYYSLGIGASANFEIYNTNYGRTDLLITQSTGNATFTGNVTLSDGALTVYESAATSPAISATSGWGGGVSNPIINFGRVGSAVAGSIGYDDPSTCLYIGTTTSHKLKFRTNNVDAITIDTSQNVGIGTTSPTSAKLVVAGDIDVWSSTNTLLRSSHNGSYGSLQTFTSGAYGILALNPGDGNVGIGTTGPNANLQVNRNTSTANLLNLIDVCASIGNNNGSPGNHYPSGIRVYQGSGTMGTGLAVMNIGVSTNSAAVTNKNTGLIETPNGMTGGLKFNCADTSASIRFQTDNTERMRITSGGDIQIPTNSASLQLRSSGSSAYTSIRRDAANQLIVANTAGNQVFGIGNGGELAITNGASYSGTETYSNAWNAGYQTLILGSQLSPNSVYMITINVGGGFGTPPYYASAVFTIVTGPGTNSTGGGFDNIAPTATHVSSNAYWKYRLSCISTGRNGVEAWLVNGPTNPPVNPTIYVKATKIMTM